MIDCINLQVRDQLPEFASGMLSPADARVVDLHVATCAECAQELEVIRLVHQRAPSATAAIDMSAIVRAIPSAPRRPQLTVSTSRPKTQFRGWRMAAGIAAVAVAGLSMQVVRNGLGGFTDSTRLLDSATQIASGDSGYQMPDGRTDHQSVAISFGAVGDYTEEEMESIMSRIEQWDGATSTEPMTTLPLLPNGGGDD